MPPVPGNRRRRQLCRGSPLALGLAQPASARTSHQRRRNIGERRRHAAKQPPDSVSYHFYYLQPDGKQDTIGSWSPPRLDQSADAVVKWRFLHTDDPAEAEHWRAELAAGRFPIDIENDS